MNINRTILAAAFTAIETSVALKLSSPSMTTRKAMQRGAELTSDALGLSSEEDLTLGAYMAAIGGMSAGTETQPVRDHIKAGALELLQSA